MSEDNNRGIQFRIDVEVFDVVEESDGTFTFKLRPNRERYKEIGSSKGEAGYLDRYTNLFFPQAMMQEAIVKSINELHVHHTTPNISDLHAYAESRRAAISLGLREGMQLDPSDSVSSSYIQDRIGQEAPFAVLSVDIVGSALLSDQLDDQRYGRLIQTYVHEMVTVAQNMHGFPLPYAGDGVVVVFGGPTHIRNIDMALYAAIAMRYLTTTVFREEARGAGYPEIHLRLGVDSGTASARYVGASGSLVQPSITGRTINRAVKIQQTAATDGIYIGASAADNIYIDLRKLLREASLPDGWPYTAGPDGARYVVYEMPPEADLDAWS